MTRSGLRAGAALLGIAALAGCASPGGRAPEPAGFESLFERLGKPRPGEWRYVRPESDQPFDDYVRSAPHRPTAERLRIRVVPLGRIAESEPALLPAMKGFLEAFFGLSAAVDEPAPVPEGARDEDRKQLDASMLLDALASRLPADAAACLGVLEFDLFAGELPFVFGLGSFENRSSVFSIARYRFEYINQPAGATLLRRACKVAAHEIGHIFGLRHCAKWHCVMNGSNSIFESDLRPMFLCPECLEKLRWNLGFDPARRYADLAAFYGKHAEFHPDADRAKKLKEAWERERR